MVFSNLIFWNVWHEFFKVCLAQLHHYEQMSEFVQVDDCEFFILGKFLLIISDNSKEVIVLSFFYLGIFVHDWVMW